MKQLFEYVKQNVSDSSINEYLVSDINDLNVLNYDSLREGNRNNFNVALKAEVFDDRDICVVTIYFREPFIYKYEADFSKLGKGIWNDVLSVIAQLHNDRDEYKVRDYGFYKPDKAFVELGTFKMKNDKEFKGRFRINAGNAKLNKRLDINPSVDASKYKFIWAKDISFEDIERFFIDAETGELF